MSKDRFLYKETDLLGKGTYASVYSAMDTEGALGRVALKRIEFDHSVEGCPLLLLREVGLLSRFKHPNIVPIVSLHYSPTDGVALIAFELLHCDLRQYLNRTGPIKGKALCEAASQLSSGLDFLHSHGVIHRDLKPQNVLVKASESGKLTIKIGDFGLARTYTPKLGKYTKEVMTLWYRCPELLLGGSLYGPAGDCWGLGCLIGEMGSGNAMFSGECEIAVLFRIFKTLGTPNDKLWKGVSALEHFSSKFPKWTVSEADRRDTFFDLVDGALETPKDRIKRLSGESGLSRNSGRLTQYSKILVDVIDGIFQYVPGDRWSAKEVGLRLDGVTSPRHIVRE